MDNKEQYERENRGEMPVKNVILITIDCLRTDHVGCYGYSRNTTPFIDALASKGTVFTHFFANGPFTSAAFPAILSSSYALDNGKVISLKGRTLVSEILQREGITTAGIHSNLYLSSQFGYDRGFDYFEDFLNNAKSKRSPSGLKILAEKINDEINTILKKKNFIPLLQKKSLLKNCILLRSIPYSSAEEITKYAVKWSNNISSSFFLWIHYMDLHEPYVILNTNIPQTYSKSLSRFSQSKVITPTKKSTYDIFNIYDDKLRYIDSQIQLLHTHIEKEKKDTVMIISSDHGQEIFDHGNFGHRARYYEEILHIPLIISGPIIGKEVINRMYSQVDISPTILSFFTISPPPHYCGLSLFSESKKMIISESSEPKDLNSKFEHELNKK